MIIKTCGMRDADNIRAVSELGIDWMGFIFWAPSSRYVSEKPTFLPTRQKRVGVFVDARIEEVKSKADEYALDLIQLHGSESPAFCERLKANSRQQLIKAFNIATQEDLEQTTKGLSIISCLTQRRRWLVAMAPSLTGLSSQPIRVTRRSFSVEVSVLTMPRK